MIDYRLREQRFIKQNKKDKITEIRYDCILKQKECHVTNSILKQDRLIYYIFYNIRMQQSV